MKVLERLLVDSKLSVHVLVVIFAISSWVDINGMWVELPIFVARLPEQWTLPSHISILGQIANLGPLIFVLIAYCLKRNSTSSTSRLTLDKGTSYVIMLVGVVSCLLLAFLWERTGYLAGAERSVALLALSFLLSFVDCTSSVAYVAFMAALKSQYLPSFFFGEGLSGLLPALIALGQGAGDVVCANFSSTEEKNVSGVIENVTIYAVYPQYLQPRFSVQVFFFILTGLIVASLISFVLINHCGYCKDEFLPISSFTLSQQSEEYEQESTGKRKAKYNLGGSSEKQSRDNGISNNGFDVDGVDLSTDAKIKNDFSQLTSSKCGQNAANYYLGSEVQNTQSTRIENRSRECVSLVKDNEKDISMVTVALVLTQVVVINFLITSFLLSVQVYSSLPYGISTYSLVVTLTNIANPVACFISLFLAVTSIPAIGVLTTLGIACGAYIITAAAMSPEPPLFGTSAGTAVVILTWIGASFFLTYAKVSIAGLLRRVGRRALIWYGVATQLGALIGSVTAFVLVNEIKLFKDASWC